MPEPAKGSLSLLDRFVRVICEEGQKRLGETRQIPERDPRLVREGVSAVVVYGAEHSGGVVRIHEGARTVVDRFAREGHVVGVHNAMDEAYEEPACDQVRLAGDHALQQRAVALRDLTKATAPRLRAMPR